MTRKRIALLYLGVAATLLVVTFVVLQKVGVSRTFVENLLAKVIVRDRFRLGDANLHLGEGTLTLDQFQLGTADGPEDNPLLAVDRIEVDVDTNPLGSVGRIRQVRFEGLHLDLDLSNGEAPDLAAMLLEQDDVGEASADAPPAIFVSDSRVTLRFTSEAEPVEFTDVSLELLPEEPGGSHMVLTGTMTSPAGLETTVHGNGDFATNQFRALVEIVEFPLDPALATRFAPAIGSMLRDAELGGTAKKVKLWIEYDGQPGKEDEELVAGTTIDIEGLAGIPPVVGYPFYNGSARISATTRDNGTVRFSLADESADGDIRAKGTLQQCFADRPIFDVEVVAEDMLVGPRLVGALRGQRDVRLALDAFEPLSGRVSATAQLRSAPDGQPPRVDLDVEFQGVDANWRGLPASGNRLIPIDFPESARDVRGKLHIRNRELIISDVQFDVCGGHARLDGNVGLRSGDPTVIEYRCDELEFSDRVRAALESILPNAVSFYDEYSPTGRAGLQVSVLDRAGTPTETRVKIRPLGASARYASFPYRLDELRGLVEIEPAGVSFDLVGGRGDARASLHGRFRNDAQTAEGAPLRTELWINVDDVKIDTALGEAIATLGDDFVRTWDYLAPGGTGDCELTLWAEADANDLSYDVRVDAKQADLELETLPMPLRNVRGPIFVHGDGPVSRIDIGIVSGELANEPGVDPARLTVQGTVHTHATQGPKIDVVSTVRSLQLTDTLRDALHENGSFNQATWNVLRPSGFVDVVARQTREHDSDDIQHSLGIELAGVKSSAEMLPAPAERMFGEVVVDKQVAYFNDIRCTMAGTEVFCSEGRAMHDGTQALFDATVTCNDFPVDRRIANLLSGPLRQTYLDRDLTGRLNINRLALHFRFPDESDAFELDADGRFTVRDLALTLGARFEEIAGVWRIDASHVDGVGGFVEGKIESGGMTTVGHRINGAQMRFRADADHIELFDMRGRLHTGELFGLATGDEPDLRYEFADDGRLELALGLDDVSLSQALRAMGAPTSEYRGNVSGELRLDELRGVDIVNSRGRGTVSIAQGRLGEVPLFTAIYSHLSPKRRPRFSGVSMNFAFGDQRCQIDDLAVESPLLSVQGRGSVSMDGYLDLVVDFADLFGNEADWLVLPSIARILTTGVVRFQVFGFLRAPEARPQWLWESKPPRVRLGPIPARDR